MEKGWETLLAFRNLTEIRTSARPENHRQLRAFINSRAGRKGRGSTGASERGSAAGDAKGKKFPTKLGEGLGGEAEAWLC